MDFVADQLADGRRFRSLTIVDIYTRECLAIESEQRLKGEDVVRVLNRTKLQRGVPKMLYCDNGSEFSSQAMDLWAYQNGVRIAFSRLGKPTDNAFVESFNGTFRTECLDAHWFTSLTETQHIVETWRREYNESRLHRALRKKTPNEFANEIAANRDLIGLQTVGNSHYSWYKNSGWSDMRSGLREVACNTGITYGIPMNELILSPDLFPVNFDAKSGSMGFVPMSRDSYRISSFLDSRAVRSNGDSSLISLEELFDAQKHRLSSNPVHYILHGGFCCSTLLTRYLDLVPTLFLLREPAVLRQVSLLRRHWPSIVHMPQLRGVSLSWDVLLELTLRLLGRTYGPEEIVIIKANDVCNLICDALLDRDDQSKIIFMSTKLRVFLLSVLKASHRRQWIRNRVNILHVHAHNVPILTNIDVNSLKDAEAAAYVWLSYSYIFQSFLEKAGAKRIYVLDGDDVAYRAKNTLLSVAEFLDIHLPNDSVVEILSDWSCSVYSKDLTTAFDSRERAKDLDHANVLFGTEADSGLEWAAKVASDWISECPY